MAPQRGPQKDPMIVLVNFKKSICMEQMCMQKSSFYKENEHDLMGFQKK